MATLLAHKKCQILMRMQGMPFFVKLKRAFGSVERHYQALYRSNASLGVTSQIWFAWKAKNGTELDTLPLSGVPARLIALRRSRALLNERARFESAA